MERAKDLLLFRVNRLAAAAGRPLIRLCEGKYGITRRQWRLIVILAQDGPQLSTALAHRASVEPARTSRAITELEDKGLAFRVRRPNDRRFVEIRLTEEGQRVYEALFPTVEAINQQLVAGLSESEQKLLAELLKPVEDAAMRLPETVPHLPKANRRRKRD